MIIVLRDFMTMLPTIIEMTFKKTVLRISSQLNANLAAYTPVYKSEMEQDFLTNYASRSLKPLVLFITV